MWMGLIQSVGYLQTVTEIPLQSFQPTGMPTSKWTDSLISVCASPTTHFTYAHYYYYYFFLWRSLPNKKKIRFLWFRGWVCTTTLNHYMNNTDRRVPTNSRWHCHWPVDRSRASWVAQSVKGLTPDFASGHDLMVHELTPCSRALHWLHGARLGFSLSPSLFAPPPLMRLQNK